MHVSIILLYYSGEADEQSSLLRSSYFKLQNDSFLTNSCYRRTLTLLAVESSLAVFARCFMQSASLFAPIQDGRKTNKRERTYKLLLYFGLNPIRPGLLSLSPGPSGLRGPDAKNQG